MMVSSAGSSSTGLLDAEEELLRDELRVVVGVFSG